MPHKSTPKPQETQNDEMPMAHWASSSGPFSRSPQNQKSPKKKKYIICP